MAWDVMKLFERFNQVGVSVLVATHAIDLVDRLGKRVIHLEGGRIVDKRPTAASKVADADAKLAEARAKLQQIQVQQRRQAQDGVRRHQTAAE